MSRRSRRRTPQEKKALSYARDCRNTYGENPEASRRAIAFHKRRVNRSNRRAEQQLLVPVLGTADLAGPAELADSADSAQTRVEGRAPTFWRKWPDAPLGEYLVRRSERTGRRAPAVVPRARSPKTRW